LRAGVLEKIISRTLDANADLENPGREENPMFESLDDEIRRDDKATSTQKERRLFYAAVMLVSLILFGGLIAGIQYLE
jgi:hypothetical protein